MRAAVLRAYNADLAIEDVPAPHARPTASSCTRLACGVCRSDWHGWTGEHPRVKPGQIPGHEYCGEVVEAGPLAPWHVGDRLVAPFILACGHCPACQSGNQNTCPDQRLPGFVEPGAFAEYVSVPFAHNLARLPDEHGADHRRRPRLPRHHRLARADRPRRPQGRRVAGDPRHRRHRPLDAAHRPRPSAPASSSSTSCQEKLAHALAPRRRRRGRRPRRRHGAAPSASSPAAAPTSRSRRSASPRRRTPRSNACGRSAATSRSGCRSATPRFMEINMNAVYMKNLALFGTRGMPSWRYPVAARAHRARRRRLRAADRPRDRALRRLGRAPRLQRPDARPASPSSPTSLH